MSLAHKLYKIGKLVTKDEIKELIEVTSFKEKDYITLQVNFEINNNVLINPPEIKKSSLDTLATMFTKKIGGTSNSYYLYPNFEYQKEKDLYKKFKAIAYTFENSVLVFANESNQKQAAPVFEYIANYSDDILHLKDELVGNYFLVITINGKSIYELMPEIWDSYFDNFVEPHISKKVKGANTPQLQEAIDFITFQKELCGYNPNVKFFTMDNYNDSFKPQIINRLPMSKVTATAIKKGWMYAINHLKFYHKGLEYIIIPSIVKHDENIYKELLKFLRKSNDIEIAASKEGSFIRRLSQQIEAFDSSYINAISLDILFTEVNRTNLSVKIFSTLEDVIPSRIRQVVKEMQDQEITDSIKHQNNQNFLYLRDYFSRDELFAIATKNTAGMKNKIIQEKIYLAKLLLGYQKIDYVEVLKRCEHQREYDYEHNKKLDEGIKNWINYPDSFVTYEERMISFLTSIKAIKIGGNVYE